MEGSLKKGKFETQVFKNSITISDGEQVFTMDSGNIDKAAGILDTALRIESFPILPERLHSSPFVILFNKDRTFTLETEEINNPERIQMTFDEAYILRELLDMSKTKWVETGRIENLLRGQVSTY